MPPTPSRIPVPTGGHGHPAAPSVGRFVSQTLPRDVPQTPAMNPERSFMARVRVQPKMYEGPAQRGGGPGAADALRAFPAPPPGPAASDSCCSPVRWLPAFDATRGRLSDVHRLHVLGEQSLFQRSHLKAYAGTKLKGLLII